MAMLKKKKKMDVTVGNTMNQPVTATTPTPVQTAGAIAQVASMQGAMKATKKPKFSLRKKTM